MLNQILPLREGWELMECPHEAPLSPETLHALAEDRDGDWIAVREMPRQVHEILLEAGRIEDPAGYEAASRMLWVGERHWVYRLRFDAPAAKAHRLSSQGLDTLAEISLNGEQIASHDNFYLPFSVDLGAHLQARDNVLILHFTSPWKWLETHPVPDHLKGVMHPNRMLRKPHEDFNGFNGAHPHYTTIGVFAEVELHCLNQPQWTDPQITARLDIADNANGGTVHLQAGTTAIGDTAALRYRVSIVKDGQTLETREDLLTDGMLNTAILLDAVEKWYPRGYGTPALYTARIELLREETVIDTLERTVGFRHIEVSEDKLQVSVNGLPVKLWGANLTPVEGRTKRYHRERTLATLDLAEIANCVSLRTWGPGAPWHDEIYDECDRRGILVWAEFFHTWGAYPDTPDFYEACSREAVHELKRLAHHACIFTWCGGNEVYMGWEREHGRTDNMPARELFESIYPELVRRHDPEQRHYLINSPYGGAFPNDARVGESHAYTHQNFVPGEHYPILFAENTRVSTPLLKSMRRFIPKEHFWPEGFTGSVPLRKRLNENTLPQSRGETRRLDAAELPESWTKLTLGADFLFGRMGPVGDFYDTGDTPAGLIYRYGAAHAKWIRESVERYRRGRPWWQADTPRRTQGHYIWKLNSTWPMIFSDMIDYLLEPNMAYYALKRAYAPLLVCFDITDHIRPCVINDRAQPVTGTLTARLYDANGTGLLHEQSTPVQVGPGEATWFGDLDEAGMFLRANHLHLELTDPSGAVLASCHDLAGIERNIGFPNPNLTIQPNQTGDGVIVTTDQFARCVELQGLDADGDAFGWIFEDNFFDLLPHERKAVQILGRRRPGTITASSLFASETAVTPDWDQRNTRE